MGNLLTYILLWRRSQERRSLQEDSMSDKKYPNGKHPNSLKNLVRAWDSESAKEAQLKGAKARSANAKLRN